MEHLGPINISIYTNYLATSTTKKIQKGQDEKNASGVPERHASCERKKNKKQEPTCAATCAGVCQDTQDVGALHGTLLRTLEDVDASSTVSPHGVSPREEKPRSLAFSKMVRLEATGSNSKQHPVGVVYRPCQPITIRWEVLVRSSSWFAPSGSGTE